MGSDIDVLADALIPTTSPSDVVIVPRDAPRTPATRGSQALATPRIAIARVSQPALTTWLRDAINRVLQGLPPDGQRPSGILIEHGAFAQADLQVSAQDWYGGRRRLVVARCSDADTARRLVEHLNALLGDRAA